MSSVVPVVDPPESALLIRMVSPGFTTAPPEIVHPERIPIAVSDAAAATRQREFRPRTLSVWLLHDVVVACEGLVFDRDGRLYRPSITQHHPAEIEWAADQLRPGVRLLEHDGPLVLGKKRGTGNYGHWLMEMLPMLHLVQDRLRDCRLGALVHDVTDPQLGGVMQASLRRVGIDDSRVRISGLAPVRVRTLILVAGMTEHGCYMSPLVRESAARLLDGVGDERYEKIFIARGAGARRNFRDAASVEALARENGFHVLQPGLSLLQQIAALRSARVVAGAMGAAMTNLCFARAPAQVVLFAGAGMPDTFFWFLANLFGHRYREIRCLQTDADPSHAAYDGDLLIDAGDVRPFLVAA